MMDSTKDGMSNEEAAGYATMVATALGHKVVSDDWPCWYEPECGHMEASMFPRFRERRGCNDDFPWPVVSFFEEGDPFEPYITDYEHRKPDEQYVTFHNLLPVPDYARDLEAAMQIPEELNVLWFSVGREHAGFKPRYDVEIYDDPDMTDRVLVSMEEDLPLVICKALLRWWAGMYDGPPLDLLELRERLED